MNADWNYYYEVRIKLVKEKRRKYKRRVNTPSKVIDLVREIATSMIGDADREMLMVICLDTKLQVNAVNIASIGITGQALSHPREVFKPAILSNASSIIVVHNHVSGDITPSESDKKIARRFRDVGEILGIPLLDFIIIGDDNYYSFSTVENWKQA